MNYFRLKTTWTAEKEDGGLEKVTTEELVLAETFGNAEEILYALAETQNRTQYAPIAYDIVKTKIEDVIWNDSLTADENLVHGLCMNFFSQPEDSGMGLYAVKIMYVERDERTAKDKRTQEIVYVPANSNLAASECVEAYLKKQGETRYHVIRDVKYDKVEAILWPVDVYQFKTNNA